MLLKFIGFMRKAAGGGGASGNFTFSTAQTQFIATTGADPAAITLGTAITAGNLLVAVLTERSGGDETTHVVTDTNGKTWTKRVEIDNSVPGNEASTRFTATVWTRVVDATGETSSTPTINGDDGTGNNKVMAVQEISPSAAYNWTYSAGAVAGSGAADFDNLNSGAASPSGDDVCVLYFAACRSSTDRINNTTATFDEADASSASAGASNGVGFILGLKTTSQADSASYSATVDTAGSGSGNEGVCATVCFVDGP